MSDDIDMLLNDSLNSVSEASFDNSKIQDSEIDSETEKLIKEFTIRYLDKEQNIKTLKEDIKLLKQEYSEQGLAVRLVIKAINNIKRNKKITQNERTEIELIQRTISLNGDISEKIASLV